MRKMTCALEEFDLNIEEQVVLAPFTTMKVGGPARYFLRIRVEEDLPNAIKWARNRDISILVLGEGSNIIVSDQGFSGLVLKIEISGIQCTLESSTYVEVLVGAGESWDSFVEHTVEQEWWGIENMSLIPGAVGSVAVQNVSAYGQEARNVIVYIRAYDKQQNKFVILNNDSCQFGFRKSIFNTTESDRYVIVAICFRLSKLIRPCLSRRNVVDALIRQREAKRNIHGKVFNAYRGIILKKRKIRTYSFTQDEIRRVIIQLRTCGKLLPSPDTVGNSGTFFRASVLSLEEFNRILLKSYRNIGFVLALKLLACRWKLSSPDGIKIPSKMLIEACRLGEIYSGAISLFQTNNAVLINSLQGATSKDILKIVQIVRTTVYERTGLEVLVEPTLVGFSDADLQKAFSLPGKKSEQ